MENNMTVTVVTVSVNELKNIVEDVVDKTMEKWYDKERRQAREEQLDKDQYLTLDELLKLTGYSKASIYNKIADGTIKAYKKPGSNRNRFRKQEIIEGINSGLLKRQ